MFKENIPYIVYLILLLMLILPSFILTNNKLGIIIKNGSIWFALFIVVIIIYKKFIYIDTLEDEINKNVYLKTIDDIITMKENGITSYIEKYSSSYH